MAYEHKITYILEMLDPDQLRPKAVDVPCLRIERMGTPCPELNWFLHIETFDPHEPFYTQAHYKAIYPHRYEGPHFDWPPYRTLQEMPEQVQHVRYEYASPGLYV